MKTLFIEARSNVNIIINKNQLKKLPKSLALATTVQHVHKIKELKEHLEKNNKKIILLKGRHSKYPGQVLGCDSDIDENNINKKTIKSIDAILYVGTGSFHPVDLAIKSGKEVFVYNPANKVLSRIDNEDIDKAKKRRKGALIKFLSSNEIGVLVSVKPGQYNIKKAMELEKKYKQNFYYFLFDTLDFNELENFPFIECFVNTACPRMADDCGSISKPLVNIEEIIYIKFKYSSSL